MAAILLGCTPYVAAATACVVVYCRISRTCSSVRRDICARFLAAIFALRAGPLNKPLAPAIFMLSLCETCLRCAGLTHRWLSQFVIVCVPFTMATPDSCSISRRTVTVFPPCRTIGVFPLFPPRSCHSQQSPHSMVFACNVATVCTVVVRCVFMLAFKKPAGCGLCVGLNRSKKVGKFA